MWLHGHYMENFSVSLHMNGNNRHTIGLIHAALQYIMFYKLYVEHNIVCYTNVHICTNNKHVYTYNPNSNALFDSEI